MEKMKPQPKQPCNIITKRIGNTTYKVTVYFSTTSKETLDKKIMRLIKNDMGAVS